MIEKHRLQKRDPWYFLSLFSFRKREREGNKPFFNTWALESNPLGQKHCKFRTSREMWMPKQGMDRGQELVAVAIDKDKNSQSALKWAIDNVLQRGQTVILIHVNVKAPMQSSVSSHYAPRFNQIADSSESSLVCKNPDQQTKELFLPFRCFCTRKDINCKDIVLEDLDVGRALVQYVSQTAIETLVLGATTKTGFLRFKANDIPNIVLKGAPDFCSVYVISKTKVQSARVSIRPTPLSSPLRSELQNQSKSVPAPALIEANVPVSISRIEAFPEKPQAELPRRSTDKTDFFRSPLTRRGVHSKSYGDLDLSMPDTDISFVCSGRPSIDRMLPPVNDSLDPRLSPPMSQFSDMDSNHSFESMQMGRRSIDIGTPPKSFESGRLSSASQGMDDVEAEMRRLKLELKQTMEMYSTACKEALTAKQKARELQAWKQEEERRLEKARLAEEAALALAEKEKAKTRAATEHAEAAQRLAEMEARKRMSAELKARREAEEKKRALDALNKTDVRYRRYTIEEIEEATENFSESLKIAEGGYGPVYKGMLDYTPVAIKVLRPNASQGRSQFQQEVEVLCCIRHPNMVLLLGACPEYGCLVYEFMDNGSLEDRLFRRGDTPALPWQLRFGIAAEIGTGLLFLHQTKPEPLVHRDLKPANILLDRNFVSKISDVGLARLVPPSVADSVTQYRFTSAAGTFCYIDPEYQQTGMLGIKSDIYSLGIIFLQILTAKSPMGLAHQVERALEKGTFEQMLDPAVSDWPIEDAKSLAKMAVKCSELRRRDRPDLGKVVLPELNRLRSLAEATMHPMPIGSPLFPGHLSTTNSL